MCIPFGRVQGPRTPATSRCTFELVTDRVYDVTDWLGLPLPSEVASATIQQNKQLNARVNALTTELEVWKQSRSAVADDAAQLRRKHEEERLSLIARIRFLESQHVRRLSLRLKSSSLTSNLPLLHRTKQFYASLTVMATYLTTNY